MAEPIEPDSVAERRRAAAGELGDALRELAANAVLTDVDAAELRRVASVARSLAASLTSARTETPIRSAGTSGRDDGRMFNPAVGRANPVAPPMTVELVDGAAVGRCTLDARYEGPPGCAHGGVSAMLLDQVMGHAVAAAGHPGVTARLEVRYRAVVPLHVPLRLEARLGDVLGVRASVTGSIALADAPERRLVVAEGRFVALRPEQITRLFGASTP